ncbi:MAG TPA: hypothetical protein HPP59_06410 [Deltaproteobacteria bacterium]|nr:hypothetical protein [Deltaproteobacteria bacterium]
MKRLDVFEERNTLLLAGRSRRDHERRDRSVPPFVLEISTLIMPVRDMPEHDRQESDMLVRDMPEHDKTERGMQVHDSLLHKTLSSQLS